MTDRNNRIYSTETIEDIRKQMSDFLKRKEDNESLDLVTGPDDHIQFAPRMILGKDGLKLIGIDLVAESVYNSQDVNAILDLHDNIGFERGELIRCSYRPVRKDEMGEPVIPESLIPKDVLANPDSIKPIPESVEDAIWFMGKKFFMKRANNGKDNND